MYMAPVRFGAARSYRNVDLTSRVEGATPHKLVCILFEELLKAMDAMTAAMRRGDYAQRSARQSRALSILYGLETSLDHDRGGDIARDLALIYREARRLTTEAGRGDDLGKLAQAKEMVQELTSAWEAIA